MAEEVADWLALIWYVTIQGHIIWLKDEGLAQYTFNKFIEFRIHARNLPENIEKMFQSSLRKYELF